MSLIQTYLQQACATQHCSVRALARRAGLSHYTVLAILHGRKDESTMTLRTLRAVAAVCGVATITLLPAKDHYGLND